MGKTGPAFAGILVLAAIAAIVVALFYLSDRSELVEDLPEDPVVAKEPEDPVLAEPERSAAETEPVAPDALPAAEPAAATEDAEEAGELTISGTIAVSDDSGCVHSGLSGTLIMVLWEKKSGEHLNVAVNGGEWTAVVPPNVAIEVRGIVLDGRTAFIENEEKLAPAEMNGRELRACWPPRPVLHVQDADTGAELPLVELAVVGDFIHSNDVHPGGYAMTIMKDLASPIEMSRILKHHHFRRRPTHIRLFARSPGYAWKNFSFAVREGGSQAVKLSRGGSLHVVLSGFDKRTPSVLRLRKAASDEVKKEHDVAIEEVMASDLPEDAKENLLASMRHRGWEHVPTADFPLRKDGLVRAEALLPGTYLVSAEAGDWFENPLEMGRVEAGVAVDRTTTVALHIEPLPVTALVPLKGTIRMPAVWEIDSFILTIKLLDTPVTEADQYQVLGSDEFAKETVDDGQLYRFDAGEVQPGRYSIEIKPPRHATSVTVGSGSRDEVHLVVPPPGIVSVRVVDEETAQDAPVESIYWLPKRPDASGGAFETVKRSEETGLFEFKAPVGRIAVKIMSAAYRAKESRGNVLDVRPGVNRCTVEVTRTCGILITVKDGERVIPWDSDWDVFPRAVDPGGTRGFLSFRCVKDSMRISVGAPGRYRFEFPEIDGYRPVDTQDVLVRRGEFVEHIIRLQRKGF
jgi:hypothetical protein